MRRAVVSLAQWRYELSIKGGGNDTVGKNEPRAENDTFLEGESPSSRVLVQLEKPNLGQGLRGACLKEMRDVERPVGG